MSFKMDIDRLSKEELIWELNARGIAESDTVDSLRKSLRCAISVEKESSFSHPRTFQGDANAELDICESKLTEISNLISSFSGTGSQCRKIETKIAHYYNRLEWVTSDDASIVQRKGSLLKALMELTGEYSSKSAVTLPSIQSIPTDPRLLPSSSLAAGSTVVTAQPLQTSSPQRTGVATISGNNPGLNTSMVVNPSCKSVPVYKWQLKFSGLPNESFNAFLEEVEEHCQSRNVDKVQLFASARDLFTGDALRMYNWFKRYCSDWDGLVRLLKEEYVPSSEQLWQQILARTQGASESIGLYVAVMTSLFERMPTPIPDHLRMQVLRKNILPFFQERLALTEIGSPFQLIELCRKIEETRDSVERFKPPNLSNLSLEPDLAYSCGTIRKGKNVVNAVEVKGILCWRCREPGHTVKDCPQKKYSFRCFGCGLEGFTKNSCPTCTPKPHGSKPTNSTRDNPRRNRSGNVPSQER